MQILLPEGWAPPIGYANGIAVDAGRIVFIAGQVGWDAQQRFHSAEIAPQFEQALRTCSRCWPRPAASREHICRMTAYCCDKPAYLAARRELGAIWRRHMGTHYPAMSMIFVSDLLDSPGKIELEATAVVARVTAPASATAAAQPRSSPAARPAARAPHRDVGGLDVAAEALGVEERAGRAVARASRAR